MATDSPLPSLPSKNEDSPKGVLLAACAYLLWGALPFYMKALAHVPPMEVIAHRIFWSLPVASLILVLMGRTAALRAAFRSPRILLMAVLTATLISINWGVYVWAIGAGRTLDTALGYFINPLFSIFLGAVLLKERLKPVQIAALFLAATGVAVMTWEAGSLPWVALVLTLSWGFYAFFRKALPVGANEGFFLEVALLSPFALAWMLWLAASGEGHFFHTGGLDTALLLSAGLVTAIPLMLYANGAKLLRLSTIAIMQYITPSLLFLVAVFAFHEPLNLVKLSAFVLIWAALALYSWSMLRKG